MHVVWFAVPLHLNVLLFLVWCLLWAVTMKIIYIWLSANIHEWTMCTQHFSVQRHFYAVASVWKIATFLNINTFAVICLCIVFPCWMTASHHVVLSIYICILNSSHIAISIIIRLVVTYSLSLSHKYIYI